MMLMRENRIINELLQTEISDLIPRALVAAARNPENLDVKTFREAEADNELYFMVIERDYNGLTDTNEWEKWLADIRDAEAKNAGIRFPAPPPAPLGVNRLHAMYSSYVEQGLLTLSDRILLTCILKVRTRGENMLCVEQYDGEKDLGIAYEFYSETLPRLATRLGIRFITGVNNSDNISFFTDKIGRYTYWQLTTEARVILFPDVSGKSLKDRYRTIQFLDATDIERYVQQTEINNS